MINEWFESTFSWSVQDLADGIRAVERWCQ